MRTLQSRIKTTRLTLGLSQAGLAKQTGVSQPTVANWETGSHIPRQKALEKIGMALDVEPDWLLSGDYAKAHNTVQDYLSRPIRHVPIYNWPETAGTLFAGHPDGYLTYPAEAQTTVALIERSKTSTAHKIWIIDTEAYPATDTDLFLWDDGANVTISNRTEKPTGATPVGQLKAEIKTY